MKNLPIGLSRSLVVQIGTMVGQKWYWLNRVAAGTGRFSNRL